MTVDRQIGEVAEALTADEAAALAQCEQRIERGLATFVETGQALLTVRDGQLYRDGYGTFEDYCQRRWSIKRDYADKLIQGAKVQEVLPTTVGKIANEAQTRELAPLLAEPEKLREVWTETVQRTGGKPTAAAVKEVREERQQADTAQRVQAQVEQAVAEFPELAYYADRPDKAVALAANLRAYDEPERDMRVDNLRKAIAAEERRRTEPQPEATLDYRALADAMFVAANNAAQVIARSGGAESFAQALRQVDPLLTSTWQEQFESLSDTCTEIADVCRPALRRVQ